MSKHNFLNQLYSRNAQNRLTSRRLRSVIAVINIKRSITTRKGNICAGLGTREKKLRERERERERKRVRDSMKESKKTFLCNHLPPANSLLFTCL